MSVLARTPYQRLDVGRAQQVSDAAAAEAVNVELRKIVSQQQGMFVPTTLVAARSPYAVKVTDWLILCDCTAGAITLSFPSAANVDGSLVMVIKTDASANAVTLSGTFNGVVNPTLSVRYQSKTINAGNGSYYFVPTLTAADILPGTFPGNYVISGTLEVDGNFSVNTTKFTVTASSGNTSVAGTLGVTGNLAVNTNKFTVTASNGNFSAAGTARIVGVSSLGASPPSAAAGDEIILADGSLRFTSDVYMARSTNTAISFNYSNTVRNFVLRVTAAGNTEWADASAGSNLIAGNSGGLTFTPASTFASTLASTGNFSVNTSKFTVTASSGDTAIAGALSVTGATTTSRLGVGGAAVGTGTNYINFPSGGGNFAVNNADRIAIATDVTIKGTTGGVIKIANGSASGIVTAENDTATVILGTMASTNAGAGNLCVSSSGAPSGNPTGGGFIWYEAGVGFRARGAGGTITTFAPA